MAAVRQVSVFVENRRGSLAAVCRLLGAGGYNIHALSIAERDNFGICRLIVANPEDAMKLMKARGYTVRLMDVLIARVPDRPNGLAEVLEILEKEDIFVEYLYSFVRPQGGDAIIVFKLSDPERAQEALQRKGVALLTEEQVCAL